VLPQQVLSQQVLSQQREKLMKRLNRNITIVIVLAIVWFLQPAAKQCIADSVNRISVQQLKTMLDSQTDVIVVDTRGESSYAAEHIPDAISIPYPDGIRAKNQELPKDKTIVLYCT
jgi:predicted sulfurtransferase